MASNEIIGLVVEPIYTFVDTDGTVTHIASGQLLAALVRAGAVPMLCEMADSLIACLERGDLGVEEHHALKLPESALDAPLTVGIWGDSHIVIDGAHRLWRRWKRGDRDFPAYMVPERGWRLFELHDMPGDGTFWDDFNRNAKVR